MKVNLFNHWFKYKVPIASIWESTLHDKAIDAGRSHKYKNLWQWLDDEFDVGQYYNWKEEQNYLVFHNEKHYMMFLLKL